MDKDFMQLNEKDLENVVGGTDALNYPDHMNFLKLGTQREAIEFLRSHGFYPSDQRYGEYMNLWKAAHGQ